jgi:hypothetical protein
MSLTTSKLIRQNVRVVKNLYPFVTSLQLSVLREITRDLHLSLIIGELSLLQGKWYVTHSGLLRIAKRRRCLGITTELELGVSDPVQGRWIFRATVLKSASETFVGYGDADPSNVSSLVRGAVMRVAETRGIDRALRMAYGIGICSVEEIGSVPFPTEKLPAQNANGNGNGNGNRSGPKVRDRLCQLIRQHNLDPELVKAYAVDYCGTKTLREATREQVENFVRELADWAAKDRNSLFCQLNSYAHSKPEVVA